MKNTQIHFHLLFFFAFFPRFTSFHLTLFTLLFALLFAHSQVHVHAPSLSLSDLTFENQSVYFTKINNF